MDYQQATALIASLRDTDFACPFCGETYDGAESEVAQHVVSYWGEDDHDFSCDSCGQDFTVRETIHRSFEAGKSTADLDAI